jgi:hypothetical protein
MNSPKDLVALFMFVGCGLAMTLGGGYVLTNLPIGSPWRAVDLAFLIVGSLILVIWRIMCLFPRALTQFRAIDSSG